MSLIYQRIAGILNLTSDQTTQARTKLPFFLLLTVFSSLLLFAPAVSLPQSKPLGGQHIIRVGEFEDKPLTYTDASGNVVGLFPDILNIIAQREGWHLGYVHGTLDECLNRLEKKEIQIVVDVAVSERNKKRFLFNNETVFVDWDIVYTTPNQHIGSLQELNGKTIAILKNHSGIRGENSTKNLMSKLHIPCSFVEVSSYFDVLRLLSTKRVDAGIISRVSSYLPTNGLNVKRTTITLNRRNLRFAFAKNSSVSPALMERIDLHLQKMKEDPHSIYNNALFVYLLGLPREMMPANDKEKPLAP